MADCTNTGYWTVFRWVVAKGWRPGLSGDVGRHPPLMPNRKGYWFKITTCNQSGFNGDYAYYNDAKQRVDVPVWAGGTGPAMLGEQVPCYPQETAQFFDQSPTLLLSRTPGRDEYSSYQAVNIKGNTPSGYFSDQAGCNRTPGAFPGDWMNPGIWLSTCHGIGTKRELTMLDLYKNACSPLGGGINVDFCNSLEDQGHNPRKPTICGGTDPIPYAYNAGAIGLEEAKATIEELKEEADRIAEEIIAEQRKKIFVVALIVLVILILLFLVF